MRIRDIRDRIDHGPMSRLQVLVVAIAVLCNMIDGFDILAASLVSPILRNEWGLSDAVLGVLLSAGPMGMAVGAFTLSWIADVHGRRTSMLMCLALMSVGMLGSAAAHDIQTLTMLRFVTGLGVGTMASCTGTLVFEYSNVKRRDLGLGLVTLGYPLGVIVGGIVSALLINTLGWRAVFAFGGLCSALLVPFVALRLPESLDYLIARKPRGALDKVNHILVKLGLPSTETLPADVPRPDGTRGHVFDLFRPPVLHRTVLMALAYLFYMVSSYFILSWATPLSADAGLSITAALSISILINIGGVIGGIAIGLLSFKVPFKPLAAVTMLAMGLAIIGFGLFAKSAALLVTFSVLIGFGIFGAALVLYATAARTFPVWVRATGVGMSMSAGRVGSMIGPSTAGFLLGAGLGREAVCFVLALPVIVSILFILRVPLAPISEPSTSAKPGAGTEPVSA